ncbi:MAG: T9SS type A sorting domain-containing protein, partial [Bacteroidota bacterium]
SHSCNTTSRQFYTDTTTLLRWDGLDNVNEYTIRYRHLDSTEYLEVTVTDSTQWLLAELNNCSFYEVQLQSNCFTDFDSEFTEVDTIRTACISSLSDNMLPLRNWEVFPNPARDALTVRYQLDRPLDDLSVYVYDQLGQRVLQVPVFANGRGQAQLDVQQLPAGVYYLRLQSSDGLSAARKVILR